MARDFFRGKQPPPRTLGSYQLVAAKEGGRSIAMGKRKLMLLNSLLFGLLVGVDAYGFEWANLYSVGASSSLSMSVMDPSDGGYALVGEAGGIWVLKVSPTGSVRWSEVFGAPGDVGTSVAMACDGGFAVVGQTFSQGSGVGDVWLLKLDSRGQPLWENLYGDGNNRYFPKSMRRTADCGFVVAGEVFSPTTYLTRAWAMKVRRDGTIEWSKEYGGTCGESFNSIAVTDDGYVGVGRSCSFGSSDYETGDAWVVKLNSTGGITWQKTYGSTSSYEEATSVTIAQGGLVIVGKTWSGDQQRSDGWAMKLDSSGNILWQKIYGDSEFDELNFVMAIGDEYLLAGMACPSPSDGCNALLQKVDADGNVLWQNLYKTQTTGDYSAGSWVISTSQTGDNGFLLAAPRRTLDGALVARTDSQGNVFGCDYVVPAQLKVRSAALGSASSTAVPVSLGTGLTPLTPLVGPSPASVQVNSICELLERTTLDVLKTGTGSGLVTSSPTGIDCGSDCSETFPSGTTVDLTATPSQGSSFAGWGGDCADCGSALTCQIVVDANKSCVAQFLDLKTLTVRVSGSGAGTISSSPSGIVCGTDCTEDYPEGTSVVLTATPSSGHWFWGWAGDCSSCGMASSCSLTMEADKSCQATFVIPKRLTVTKSGIGTGTITSNPPGIDCGSDCIEEFPLGSSVTLRANPGPTSIFTGWGRSCLDCGTNSECLVTLDQEKACNANFIAAKGLTVVKSGTGTGTVTSAPPGIDCGVDCQESFREGTNVTLNARAAPGSTFSGWRGACALCGSNPSCSVFAYTDRTCEAVFTDLNSLSITKMGGGTGTITSSPPGIDCGTDCVEEYLPGTAVTLTAKESPGSVFSGWTGACSGCGELKNCSVVLSEDKACGAVFSKISTVRVTKAGTGAGTVVSSEPSPGINCGTDCIEAYPEGFTIILTAQPSPGSFFGGWGGACSGNVTTCVLTLDGDKTVEATFNDSPGAVLVVTKTGTGGGLVKSKPAGIYCGSGCNSALSVFGDRTRVKLKATPDSESKFMGWTGACASFGSSQTCTIIMDSDKEVGLVFSR